MSTRTRSADAQWAPPDARADQGRGSDRAAKAAAKAEAKAAKSALKSEAKAAKSALKSEAKAAKSAAKPDEKTAGTTAKVEARAATSALDTEQKPTNADTPTVAADGDASNGDASNGDTRASGLPDPGVGSAEEVSTAKETALETATGAKRDASPRRSLRNRPSDAARPSAATRSSEAADVAAVPAAPKVAKFRKSAPAVVEIVPLTPTQRIESACLTLVGPELRRMLLVSLPMTLLTIVAMWSHAGPARLLLWAALAVASSVVLGFVAGFETPLDVPGAIAHRRREVTVACGAVSIACALGILAVFPSVRPAELRAVLAVSVFGAFGAMGLGTQLVRPAMYAMVGPVGVVTCLRFLLGSGTDRNTALVGFGLLATFALHGTKANATAVALVRNRIENDLLSRKLQRSLEMRGLLEDELQRAADADRSDDKDPITGIRNRGSFLEALGDHWQQAEAGFDPFTIALIDIDQFDDIRERYGTDVANELLKQVADLVDAGLRTDDKLARVSNSQFSVLLNNALSDGAVICLERIRRKVAATPLDAGEPVVISISAGIVTWDKGLGMKQLMAHADASLQKAKELGGNQLDVWKA